MSLFRVEYRVFLLRDEDCSADSGIGSGLVAVEQAGREEDQRDHQGEAGVLPVVQTKADQGVHQPRGEAGEPDPGSAS